MRYGSGRKTPSSTPSAAVPGKTSTPQPDPILCAQLGTDFPVRLEARHVVDVQRQVWAGVLGGGPSGQALQATYQHSGTRAFQQAVGACVLATVQAVPDGLLVFTPSYSLLSSLSTAWKVRPVRGWARPVPGLLAATHRLVSPGQSGRTWCE